MSPLPAQSTQRFTIEIRGEWTLSVEDIWPDGDAPENPTEQDVRDCLPRVRNLISEWNLVPDVEVWS